MFSRRILHWMLGVLFLQATAVSALPVTYTDPAAFAAALPHAARVIGFEGVTAGNDVSMGTIIDDGTSFDGITFSYPELADQGVALEVRDDFDAVEGDNYLGTTDAGVFLNTDIIDFSFAPSYGFGLFAITGDVLFDGDLTLTANGVAAQLAADAIATLADGSSVFFLGVIDMTTPFTMASLAGFTDPPDCDQGCFSYNLDALQLAANDDGASVSEPATAALLLVGVVAIGLSRRRRSAIHI